MHKAAGLEIKLSKTMTTMVYYSVSNVLWKAIAFPFWSAIESRCNKNMVSLVSSVTMVMHLPISWTSSMADWPHVPAVSTATRTKICETDSAMYLAVLLADALLAAAPASLAVWLMCDSA